MRASKGLSLRRHERPDHQVRDHGIERDDQDWIHFRRGFLVGVFDVRTHIDETMMIDGVGVRGFLFLAFDDFKESMYSPSCLAFSFVGDNMHVQFSFLCVSTITLTHSSVTCELYASCH